MTINFCLHNIVKDLNPADNIYTLTLKYFEELVGKANTKGWNCRYYLDDGYKSFYEYIFRNSKFRDLQFTVAIPTEYIGSQDHLKKEQLVELSKNGINIASHGVSHSSLAIYIDDNLQPTPDGGRYRNTQKGRLMVLKKKEVLYQLKKSKIQIEKILGQEVKEFVLPYGLYNSETIEINGENRLYDNLTTCDFGLDHGQLLRPRYLCNRNESPEDVVRKISQFAIKS